MARTPKGRALGNALRRVRESKKMTLRSVSELINIDNATLSRWETGERMPKPEYVARLLTVLETSAEQYEEIMTLCYGADQAVWFPVSLPEQRQQLTAFLDYEQNARKLTVVSPLLVPGLLQVESYIRAIMSRAGVPIVEVADRITTRIGRRNAVDRPSEPVDLVALVGEGVLYQGVGGTNVMIEQLRHLLEKSTSPNVDLRIIPFDADWHPGLEGLFTLIESDRNPTVVHLENRRSGWLLHEDRDVVIYQRAANAVMQVSMPAGESRKIIATAIRRMEKKL